MPAAGSGDPHHHSYALLVPSGSAAYVWLQHSLPHLVSKGVVDTVRRGRGGGNWCVVLTEGLWGWGAAALRLDEV